MARTSSRTFFHLPLVMGLCICLGCPSTEPVRLPEAWTQIAVPRDELASLLDRVSSVSPPESDLVVTGDRTDVYVAGGATFGTSSTNMIPVTLSLIEVSTTGGPLAMAEVKVYTGSGKPPPTPPSAGLVATRSGLTGGETKELEITVGAVGGDATPRIYDASADDEYWIWVHVSANDGSGLVERNAQRRIKLVQDKIPVEFPIEW